MHLVSGFVQVRGARQHNLADVDVDVPRDTLVAFTGVSGSGKSSLAFATIYAEAQRRYFESVAPYARRLIRQVGAPDVSSIGGLPPAVALAQPRSTFGSRSTVGTITSLSSTLRLLYSRAGSAPRGAPERLPAEAFSPNTPEGACPECQGQGTRHTVTEATLVPDPKLSIRQGAIAGWPGAWQGKNLRDIAIALGVDVDRPFGKLPKKQRDFLLFSDEQPIVLVEPGEDRNEYEYNGKFVSAKRHVLSTIARSPSERMRQQALRYVVAAACDSCGGSGVHPDALRIRLRGLNIAELGALPLEGVRRHLTPLSKTKSGRAKSSPRTPAEATDVARALSAELVEKIAALVNLGLGHLSLHRKAPTLSSGEIQRLRLATALHAGLFGVVYVLDEPCAGLHPSDAAPLYEIFEQLRAGGNSLFVVEHSMELVKRAGWLVDVGPGAGAAGGRVIYSGPPAGLRKVRGSVTRRYLYPSATEENRVLPEPREPKTWLCLGSIERHNLSLSRARFPLGVMSAVTGVSGSGKSTLVVEILAGTVLRALGRGALDEEGATDIEARKALERVTVTGLEHVERLVVIDQKPLGRTSRSNAATYTGLFQYVRALFSQVRLAKRRGWGPGHFSFNVAGGRCETCQGAGFVSVEMLFLASRLAPCPDCRGSRFQERTLEIKWREKSIAEVLELTVDDALVFFEGERPIVRSLLALQSAGLGYLALGQPAPELSGGEAQRVRLAAELQRKARGHTLYVLDEPTTSLHPADVERLVVQLQNLVDGGHTVVLVEHAPQVIARADWVIDLGPGGGSRGGKIVASGPPRRVASSKRSRTAIHLREFYGSK